MKVNRFFRGLQNTVGLNRSPTLTWLSAIFLLLAALGSNSAFAQSLLTSEQPNRANAIELEGAEVAGDVHVFFGDTGSIRSVVFYLDDEDTTGSPNQTENFAPYDFAGTVSGNGRPFDTTTINDGPHSITAVVTAQNGTQSTVTAQFNVVNNPVTDPDEPVDTSEFSLQTSSNPDRSGAIDLEAATTSDIIYIFLGFTNTPSQVEFFLDNADAVGTPNQTEGRAPFDFAGTGSGDVALPFDTNTIADGLHSVTARITTATNEVGTIGPVFFTVSNTEPQDDDPPPPPPTACAPISTLPCIDVRLIDSLALDFTGNAGGIEDANGIGTGFTMVDVPSFPGNPTPNQNAPGLFADNVVVDQTTGKLQITTTPGINYLGTNSLDNALGFGLNVPSSNIAIEATLSDLPTPAGGFSQGGIWFGRGANFGLGTSEDSYIKMVAISTASGSYSVQALMENGVTITQNQQGIPATTAALTLRLELDPVARTVVAKYNTGGQDVVLSTFTQVPDDWFSFDQAGVDPQLATRSFGGIFATQRNVASALNPQPVITIRMIHHRLATSLCSSIVGHSQCHHSPQPPSLVPTVDCT